MSSKKRKKLTLVQQQYQDFANARENVLYLKLP